MGINKKLTLAAVLALVTATGCMAKQETTMRELTASEVETMITEAEKARKKAASVDGEWRDTGKMIKQAQAALKEGKLQVAADLAQQAKAQGELGYDQAVSQKELRMPSFFKY